MSENNTRENKTITITVYSSDNKMSNAIHLYCSAGAAKIEELSTENNQLKSHIANTIVSNKNTYLEN